MKNSLITSTFILTSVMLTSCGTSTETASISEDSSLAEIETVAAAETNEYCFDFYDYFESDEFAGCFDSTTIELNPLRLEYDMTNAYIGTPYQIADYDSNGEFTLSGNLDFPVMSENNVAAIINGFVREDGGYGGGAGISYSKELNEILTSGKQYAMITTEDRKVGFAISEDDELHLLYDYTYSDETDLSPDITFEEASKFGNVISLESLTTKVYP